MLKGFEKIARKERKADHVDKFLVGGQAVATAKSAYHGVKAFKGKRFSKTQGRKSSAAAGVALGLMGARHAKNIYHAVKDKKKD